MEFYMLIVIFVICICISSFLNIILKLTDKKNWLMSFLMCIALTIVIFALLYER
ncbi:magnesium-transporting ATPase (P-type) [Cytobacillus eiseniae]|uniref:Magnesium-transporting ATPase (P-type) n=1 Tax=Cytobacillus eiseniae TaxID=762947 RepID=A0ABS4RD60_9BACI|nr:magnesium-transporting ATPase (P-type) [Cytobacillus eiseniae]